MSSRAAVLPSSSTSIRAARLVLYAVADPRASCVPCVRRRLTLGMAPALHCHIGRSASVPCHFFPPPPLPAPRRLEFLASVGTDSVGQNAATASRTTARERRMVKLREERRRREYEREHTYPAWAKVVENASRKDPELRAILGDSIGNPELMKQRIKERVRKKGRDQFNKPKTGSIVAVKVSFRDFNPLGSFIWFELVGEPTDRHVDLLGGVIQAWYVMGRLGAYNSSNLQLSNSMMNFDPSYNSEKASTVMPSSFHDIGDVEFQDNWARVWVDLGTSDYLGLDILLNCLIQLSSEHLGIRQVIFGGKKMGDWEEGMRSSDYGYKSFEI